MRAKTVVEIRVDEVPAKTPSSGSGSASGADAPVADIAPSSAATSTIDFPDPDVTGVEPAPVVERTHSATNPADIRSPPQTLAGTPRSQPTGRTGIQLVQGLPPLQRRPHRYRRQGCSCGTSRGPGSTTFCQHREAWDRATRSGAGFPTELAVRDWDLLRKGFR